MSDIITPFDTAHDQPWRPSLLSRLSATLKLWSARIQARRDLGALSELELKDIGLSRGQVEFQANKPFWRQ